MSHLVLRTLSLTLLCFYSLFLLASRRLLPRILRNRLTWRPLGAVKWLKLGTHWDILLQCERTSLERAGSSRHQAELFHRCYYSVWLHQGRSFLAILWCHLLRARPWELLTGASQRHSLTPTSHWQLFHLFSHNSQAWDQFKTNTRATNTLEYEVIRFWNL